MKTERKLAPDTLPMPLEFVIAAGAERMEKNAAESGLGELSLHILNGF